MKKALRTLRQIADCPYLSGCFMGVAIAAFLGGAALAHTLSPHSINLGQPGQTSTPRLLQGTPSGSQAIGQDVDGEQGVWPAHTITIIRVSNDVLNQQAPAQLAHQGVHPTMLSTRSTAMPASLIRKI